MRIDEFEERTWLRIVVIPYTLTCGGLWAKVRSKPRLFKDLLEIVIVRMYRIQPVDDDLICFVVEKSDGARGKEPKVRPT
jgi:hypothetical protein